MQLSFRHFARLLVHFQEGDEPDYAASIQARLSYAKVRERYVLKLTDVSIQEWKAAGWGYT